MSKELEMRKQLTEIATNEGMCIYQLFDEQKINFSEETILNINNMGMIPHLNSPDCLSLTYKDKFIIGLFVKEESIRAFIMYSADCKTLEIRKIQRLIKEASKLATVTTGSLSSPVNDKLHKLLGLKVTETIVIKEWEYSDE